MDPRTDLRRRLPHAARNPSLDHPDLRALRARDAAADRRLDPFGERMRGRWAMYVIGSVVFLPILTAVITPLGFHALWIQLPVAAAYGTFLAFVRPTGGAAAGSCIVAGLLTLLLAGHLSLGYGLVVSAALHGVAGAAVGVGERAKLVDGK